MDRIIQVETTVAGSVDEVWRAWTTVEGVVTFFAPQADVRLEIGGPFELYFAPSEPQGLRGSEGCKVLSYLPEEVLSFSWNAPPSIPRLRETGGQTRVIVQFEEVGEGRTRIKLSQQGFGSGEDSDKYYEYFSKAWPYVLANCRRRFEEGPLDWEK
ncbi:MAG TPA: SRPBCC domain-containing protein [Acidobacteriota bacterium]|nr:SRPBCC domain-containing protein [Acidobacteriota bacterium]